MFNSQQPSASELPSTRQLLRSTAIAATGALVILFTAVLPAEYGVDPTRFGRVLGLTQMGETKVRLAREATTEDPGAKATSPAAPAPAVAPPAVAISAAKADEMTITLKPGQGAEVKVEMRKGARVTYEWTTTGGALNFDTHGDPYNAPRGFYHGYGKGQGVARDQGVLEAAFDGFHGWFWRNRTSQSVTVTLRVTGNYLAMKRVL